MQFSLCDGRPEDLSGRLEKEIRVYDLFDELNIPYQRVDHEALETMEACKAIDEILAPAVICKNLFLCNAKKTQYYLLMMRGDKKFNTREISGQIGSTRLSFAPGEDMERFLDITPGSVSVLGLMNDRDRQVKLLVDEDVLKAEYLGCHPCINTSSLRVRVDDIFTTFLDAVSHDYKIVRCGGTID